MRYAGGGHPDQRPRGRRGRRESGLLVDTAADMVRCLDTVLSDEVLRKRLGLGALDYASRFTWDATARQTLAVLGAERLRRLKRSGTPVR